MRLRVTERAKVPSDTDRVYQWVAQVARALPDAEFARGTQFRGGHPGVVIVMRGNRCVECDVGYHTVDDVLMVLGDA